MRHTPGPWHTRQKEQMAGIQIVTGNEPLKPIAMVRYDAHADARLIAAAPELYDAVRDAEKVLGDLLHAGEVSDAALICADRLTALLARLEDV